MFSQVIEAYDLLDNASVDGYIIRDRLMQKGNTEVIVNRVRGDKGQTDFLRINYCGTDGKSKGGSAPTLGVIGRLGGLGARPERIGFVSDGDGALTAISLAFKLANMHSNGDILKGDVVISTHICPNAPIIQHHPVPFMDSPVDIQTMNKYEVTAEMDAILSVDATKGNRVITRKGFAISPTIKQGYILRISEDLMDLMEIVTGRLPHIFPVTTQDITPYGNGLYKLNSILQPATATEAPVVGVAISSEVPVPGCGTGATHLTDIEAAARYCLEVAKHFGINQCSFFDREEFKKIRDQYGDFSHLQQL